MKWITSPANVRRSGWTPHCRVSVCNWSLPAMQWTVGRVSTAWLSGSSSQPNRPVQNAYVHNSNGKFCHECLKERQFACLQQAPKVAKRWRKDYNELRPHRISGNWTARKFAPTAAALVAGQADSESAAGVGIYREGGLRSYATSHARGRARDSAKTCNQRAGSRKIYRLPIYRRLVTAWTGRGPWPLRTAAICGCARGVRRGLLR